jgi:hypothetical protein
MKIVTLARAVPALFFFAAGCVSLDEPWRNENCSDRAGACTGGKAGSGAGGQTAIGTSNGTGGTSSAGGMSDTGGTSSTGPTSGAGGSSATSGGQGQGGSSQASSALPDASPTSDATVFADVVREDSDGPAVSTADTADLFAPDVASDSSTADLAPPPPDLPPDLADTKVTNDDAADAVAIPPETNDAGLTNADVNDGPAADTAISPNTTIFKDGYGVGLMTGDGWVSLGSLDTLNSPTCGPAPITSARPCTGTKTWSSPTALCISGAIPALPSSPSPSDFANNWGIQVGVDANLSGDPIGRQFKTLTYNMTGSPSSGLRAEIHRSGDAIGVTYCATLVPGKPITLSTFNSSCWDGTGASLTPADILKIDKVIVHIPSGSSPINVNSLCIGSIVFGT